MSDSQSEMISRLKKARVPATYWLQDFNQDEISTVSAPVTGLPDLYLPGNGISVSQFALELAEKLKAAPIFVRDGIVLYISSAMKLEPMGAEAFCTWIEDYVRLIKMSGVGEKRFPETATMTAAGASLVLNSPQFIRSLRSIRRVNQVRQPVIRKCGSLELLPKGYDAEASSWTIGSVDFAEDMSLDDAVTLLESVIKEFPWPREETMKAKSIAITSMLAVFGDMLLEPAHQRPVWIFNANREGSGKTTLMRLAICPSFGSAVIGPPPNANSPDALSKLLASAALGGMPYLCFDNWSGVVGNSALEAFITSSTYSDRVLGVSKMFSVEKQCMVLITGNHARVSPDMRRRSLIVDLEMIEACAEERVLENPMGEPEILAMRPKLLAALWAIIREWNQSGRPEGKVRHSSFQKWGHLFGGIAECLGIPNPVSAPAKAADDTLRDFTAMVNEAIGEAFNDTGRHFTAADLMEYARERGLFSWVLDPEPDDSARDHASIKRKERSSFGKICSRFDGSRFGDIEFKRGEDGRSGVNRAVARQFVIRRVATS